MMAQQTFFSLFCLLLSCWVNNKRHQHRAVPIAIFFNMPTTHNKLQFYVCIYERIYIFQLYCQVHFFRSRDFLGYFSLTHFLTRQVELPFRLFFLLLLIFFVPSDLFTIVSWYYNSQVSGMSHFILRKNITVIFSSRNDKLCRKFDFHFLGSFHEIF